MLFLTLVGRNLGWGVLFNHGLGEPAPTPKSHNSTRVKKYLQVRWTQQERARKEEDPRLLELEKRVTNPQA
jgi:hypothetical protein